MTGTSTGDGGARLADPEDTTAYAGPTRRRGFALVVGGVVLLLLVRPIGPQAVSWIPLLVGLAFVVAAALTGPRSPFKDLGWSSAPTVRRRPVNLYTDVSGAVAWITVAIGLGGLLAAYLGGRGWAMSAASVASPVVFIGIEIGVLGGSGLYALLEDPARWRSRRPTARPAPRSCWARSTGGARRSCLATGSDHRFPPPRIPYRANV